MDNRVAPVLLDWYDRHARRLPWRVMPGGRADPYRVWLSEVMLQQTTVAAVAPYFERFTRRWPTVEALAGAPEDAIMAEWAGLGYYSRARNLVACAREVARLGGFPRTEAQLRELPGLGAYTAAAVAAIAFGTRAVVVDANVERVVARLFAIDIPLPSARAAIRAAAGRITPEQRAGDFAQAMMDLGATICTSRSPRCMLCPLAEPCIGRARGRPEQLPVKPPKKARSRRRGTAWWIADGARVFTIVRPARGMLGGMRALPDDGWSARADGSGEPPFAGDWRDCGTLGHVFTHVELELRVKAIDLARPIDLARAGMRDGEWIALGDLEHSGLPTLYAKAALLATAGSDARCVR